MIYITNKIGRVIHIDEQTGNNLISTKNFRISTAQEIQNYVDRQSAMFEKSSDDSVFFVTVDNSPDGFGMSAKNMKHEMAKLGMHLTNNYQDQEIGLAYHKPAAISALKTRVRLIYTMFESDKIPKEWVEFLEIADEVIVPSKFCADAFAKRNIKTRILPLGYNANIFSAIERAIPVKEQKDFVFIHYNAFNARKGFFEVFEAFNKEFKNNEKVKLILKTTDNTSQLPIIPSIYPNIEVITGKVTEIELANLLQRSHCMVYPSRGEGFGLTPLEAMATGIPAIVPNAHGISEYFNENYMLEVKIAKKSKPIYRPGKYKGDIGKMVTCDVDDLRKKMRYAFNNQQEMHDFGLKAAEYVKRYTMANTAQELAKIINSWRGKKEKEKLADYLPVEEI